MSLEYTDEQPGDGRAATVLRRVAQVAGTASTALDITPDPFAFDPVPEQAPGTMIVSSAAEIRGTNAPAPISVGGGAYSINGAAFTTAPGSVAPGARVRLRVAASPTPGALVTPVVTVGGVSAAWPVRTLAAVGGTADTDPDPFFFSTQTPVNAEDLITATLTITGINAPTPANLVSAVGATYSINGGVPDSAPTTLNNGDRVTISWQKTRAVADTVTLVVGSRSATWTVSLVDAEPDPLSFAAATAQANTVVTSAPLTVSGINVAVRVTVGGGSYSVNGGAFTSADGLARSGDVLRLRTTSSPLPGGVLTVQASVGDGVPSLWRVSTASSGGATDTVPNPYTIPLGVSTPVPGDTPLTCLYVDSAPVTPTGYNATTTVSAVSSEPFRSALVSVAGGPYVASPTQIGPGQSFSIRILPFGSERLSSGTRVVANVTVGGVVATYSIRCG